MVITDTHYKNLIKLLGIVGVVTLTAGGWLQNGTLIIIGLASTIISQMLNLYPVLFAFD